MLMVFEPDVKLCRAVGVGILRFFRLSLNIRHLTPDINGWKALAKRLIFWYYEVLSNSK
jgi:hypothetical protein